MSRKPVIIPFRHGRLVAEPVRMEVFPQHVKSFYDNHPELFRLADRGDIGPLSVDDREGLVTIIMELLSLGRERERWERMLIDLLTNRGDIPA